MTIVTGSNTLSRRLFKTLNSSKKFTLGRGFVYLSIGDRSGRRSTNPTRDQCIRKSSQKPDHMGAVLLISLIPPADEIPSAIVLRPENRSNPCFLEETLRSLPDELVHRFILGIVIVSHFPSVSSPTRRHLVDQQPFKQWTSGDLNQIGSSQPNPPNSCESGCSGCVGRNFFSTERELNHDETKAFSPQEPDQIPRQNLAAFSE
jgi:hypothetical protein